MIISTSSSIELSARGFVAWGAWLLAAPLAACGDQPATEAQARAAVAGVPAAVAGAPATATAAAASEAALRKAWLADASAAVAGRKGGAAPPAAALGMTCAPREPIASTSALSLDLPADPADRRHVLAVVTPERGLLELYSPSDAESEDLILPSDVISWGKARGQARFAMSAYELYGLRRGSDQPEPLFIEPGRYRFVLVNGIDASLLKVNGTPVRLFAGCSYDWRT
jgi:hypothetical protein